MHFVYIIYSPKLDNYYIGETEDLRKRLLQHNSGFFDHSYTSMADDWKLFYTIECKNITQAKKIENHIKSMKSRKYIQNLIKYFNITRGLLAKYS